VGRYGQEFKDQALAKLLPPESASIDAVSNEMGISVGTLRRWLDLAQTKPALGRAWSAAARLQAVITTAAMPEAIKNGWCRSNGVYPQELDAWRVSAMQALAEPEGAKGRLASPQDTKEHKHRIKVLEREILRKDRALAETAALLVLSKKAAAIFNRDEDE
jgi:transposase